LLSVTVLAIVETAAQRARAVEVAGAARLLATEP